MHFLSVLIGVCSVIGATNAASVGETKSVKQTVNFDELDPCGVFDSPPFETPYKFLAYENLKCGSPTPLPKNIQPSSKPNMFFTRSISSTYQDSKVTSFDAKSIAAGCFAAPREGLAAPAISCKMKFTGVKAGSRLEVPHEADFKVGLSSGIFTFGQRLQNVPFPESFVGLESLKIESTEMVETGLDVVEGLEGVALDDFVHTVHFKE